MEDKERIMKLLKYLLFELDLIAGAHLRDAIREIETLKNEIIKALKNLQDNKDERR